MNKFYVYVHRVKTTGKVFYVGKGKEGRNLKIWGRNPYWHAVNNKYGAVTEIVHKDLSEKAAFDIEVQLIARYKLLGGLVNGTDGGEGTAGYWTSEAREKTSLQQRFRWSRRGERAKQSEIMKGVHKRPGQREISSNAQKGHVPSEESKRKASASCKKAWTKEVRQRSSNSHKKLWTDPDFRLKKIAERKNIGSRPEFKAKISMISKARWQDPEYRAKWMATRLENIKRKSKSI